VRGEILKLKTKTILGDFAADDRGYQTGYQAVTVQWQNSISVVVCPDEVATAKSRFPTPPW
jgi:hypothetical protein